MKSLIAALAVVVIVVAMPERGSRYDDAVTSTVWIKAGEGTGTGVFVGEHWILTAHHVVVGETSIHAYSPLREEGAVVSSPSRYTNGMACVVIASDPRNDLALLRVQGSGKPMALARAKAAPGDPLFAIGCGDSTALFGFSCGYARQVYAAEFPRVDGEFSARVIDMSVTVNLGDSGGPVVDSNGNLAGLVSGMDASKNETYLAVSISEIRAFLNSHLGR
jgi:S1-C subfamily serine protease